MKGECQLRSPPQPNAARTVSVIQILSTHTLAHKETEQTLPTLVHNMVHNGKAHNDRFTS